jgi:hypothetical protein
MRSHCCIITARLLPDDQTHQGSGESVMAPAATVQLQPLNDTVEYYYS